MERKQRDSTKIFQSLKDCASATNTPIELLLVARSHPNAPRGTSGFHQSGRIYWEGLEPWLNEHKEELESVQGETREHWLMRRDRANALLSELELEESYKRIVNKEQVHELLERVSTALVSLINSRLRQELPARLNLPADKIAEIDKVIAELFAVTQKGFNSWTV